MNTEEKLEIKSIRKCLSLTQKELADLLGVKQASVCRWEQGKGLSLKSYLKLQKLKDGSSSMSTFIAAPTDNNKHPQHNSQA
ncbi:helix-turn-helix domain-containing protein [Bartonella henselae]|uniref:helix-turn-helix domain-containing protein n=1 Tax=Bartonella henselae TaxID=38323 RepID=UPI000967ED58|nr:helix-turn-helix domain-containing protein [Bartonella henselae]OLL53372.1 transcriptional regulator [Bartonella henselae]UJM32746.1 helix-turn-helix domain-containing protein [Bartonella henselae]